LIILFFNVMPLNRIPLDFGNHPRLGGAFHLFTDTFQGVLTGDSTEVKAAAIPAALEPITPTSASIVSPIFLSVCQQIRTKPFLCI
jgi:hypothetical protein